MDEDFRKRILIVEHDAANVAELAAFLKGKNYAVKSAAEFPAAMAEVQSWKPDLVILNILIETFNALDLLAEAKKNPF